MELFKKAQEKIAELGAALGGKAKDAGAAAAAAASGNSGALGQAKGAVKGRDEKIRKLVEEADGMANGGMVGRKKVGCRPQRG